MKDSNSLRDRGKAAGESEMSTLIARHLPRVCRGWLVPAANSGTSPLVCQHSQPHAKLKHCKSLKVLCTTIAFLKPSGGLEKQDLDMLSQRCRSTRFAS